MHWLTHAFYLISTALLIPVMLALLWSLFQVLLVLGQAFREYLHRSRDAEFRKACADALSRRSVKLPELPARGLLARTLAALRQAADDPWLLEKCVQDAENAWRDELERITALARRGPALGLMGTLIPLGPALVGLAAGDLQMMSENLVLAFATTVVGLLVGTLAAALASTKRRWYRADAGLVAFAAGRYAELLSEEGTPDEPAAGFPRREGVGESADRWPVRPQGNGTAGNGTAGNEVAVNASHAQES